MLKSLRAAVAIASVAFFVPASALAQQPTSAHVTQYKHLYERVAKKLGHRAPGRNIVRWGLSTGRATSDADVVHSLGVFDRMLAPPPAPVYSSTSAYSAPAPPASSYSSSYSSSGDYSSVPGVPASFAACVAMRESTNGAGSSNIYGILGAGGTGSVAQQKAAFSSMYAQRGSEPWAPYDGC